MHILVYADYVLQSNRESRENSSFVVRRLKQSVSLTAPSLTYFLLLLVCIDPSRNQYDDKDVQLVI